MKWMIASDIHGSAYYCRQMLEAFEREKADRLILPVGNRLMYLTHGHRFYMDALPPMQDGDILLHGHTHVPAWERFGTDNWYLNPGSVSIPKQDSAHSYMTLCGQTAEWKSLDGEMYHSIVL